MNPLPILIAAALVLASATSWADTETASENSPSTKKSSKAASEKTPAPPTELDLSKMPFDAESIRQVVMHHMPEIQNCYEKVLSSTEKKLEGRITVAFNVDSNGNVTEVKALPKKSSLQDERAIDCVLAMRRWYFPKPNDNRDHPIVYPFDLKVR